MSLSVIKSVKKVLSQSEDIWLTYMNGEAYFKVYVSFKQMKQISNLTDNDLIFKRNPQFEEMIDNKIVQKYPITFLFKKRKHYLRFFNPCIKRGEQDISITIKDMDEYVKECFKIIKGMKKNNLFEDIGVVTKKYLYLLR